MYGGTPFGTASSTIPPWGALFDRKWVSVFGRYISKYGIDDLLLREADRIFTGLLGSHESIQAVATDFPSAGGEMALWRQKEHKDMKNLALRRVADLNSNGFAVTSMVKSCLSGLFKGNSK